MSLRVFLVGCLVACLIRPRVCSFNQDVKLDLSDLRDSEIEERIKMMGSATMNFALDFLENTLDKGDNIIFSPSAIIHSFGSILSGIDKSAREEVLKTLHLETLVQEEKTIAVDQCFRKLNMEVLEHTQERIVTKHEFTFNQMMIINNQVSLRPEYEAHLQKNYMPTMIYDNFKNKRRIQRKLNYWLTEQTHTSIKKTKRIKISTAVNELRDSDHLVIMNAIRFKGHWVHPFRRDRTDRQQFKNYDGSISKVFTMESSASFKAFEMNYPNVVLPYRKNTSMLIIMKDPNEAKSLKEVITWLKNHGKHGGIWKKKEYSLDGVALPKFKIYREYRLSKVLPQMGVQKTFTKCNFSGMFEPTSYDDYYDDDYSDQEPTPNTVVPDHLSENIHQVEIEVDESMTSASHTVVQSDDIDPALLRSGVSMKIDRPFIFFIYDHARKLILFAGAILKLKGD